MLNYSKHLEIISVKLGTQVEPTQAIRPWYGIDHHCARAESNRLHSKYKRNLNPKNWEKYRIGHNGVKTVLRKSEHIVIRFPALPQSPMDWNK